MKNQFADRLINRIHTIKSALCAGFDPVPEQIPAFLAQSSSGQTETHQLRTFGELFIEAVAESSACIKFNAAFFEAFGLDGLVTLRDLTKTARQAGLPVIIDAKRGDIGNTAAAYARAWLGEDAGCAPGDALTVNPFLGFDTIEPFIARCEATGTGLFVLVRTSNPGATALQEHISSSIASYLSEQSSRLIGSCGVSGLGAVVGATAGEYQRRARSLMPNNLFLVPGYGAQGATAAEALSGLRPANDGIKSQVQLSGVVNSSRGLLAGTAAVSSAQQFIAVASENARRAAAELF